MKSYPIKHVVGGVELSIRPKPSKVSLEEAKIFYSSQGLSLMEPAGSSLTCYGLMENKPLKPAQLLSVVGVHSSWRYHSVLGLFDIPTSVISNSVLVGGVITDANRRHEGHGIKLMEYVMSEHPVICLRVKADNHPALGMYRKLGFIEQRSPMTTGSMWMFYVPTVSR